MKCTLRKVTSFVFIWAVKFLSNGKKKSKGMVQRSFTEAENFVRLFAVWLRVCKFQKRMKLCQNRLLP